LRKSVATGIVFMRAISDKVKPRLPVWTIIAFAVAIGVAYAPGIIQVYGIHNNYDALVYNSRSFFHADAARLFEFARPVAGLLSNITVQHLHELSDLRWVRIFSLLTVFCLGAMLMSHCVTHLRAAPLSALLVSIAVFLVPAFTYSVLEPAAWTPHLLTVLLAFLAYGSLSRTNIRAISFLVLASRREYRDLLGHAVVYFGQWPVIVACGWCQLAFYNYPPATLIITIFPVVAVLFSKWPAPYRTLIALRDIAVIAVNIGLFYMSAKLVYLPFVRLFADPLTGRISAPFEGAFAQKVANTYDFKFQTDLGAMVERLRQLLRAVGDLWFLPQAHVHVVVGIVLLLGLVASGSAALGVSRKADTTSETDGMASGLLGVAVVALCFFISASVTILPVGGIISYRTIMVPTGIAALATICAFGVVTRYFWRAIGSPLVPASSVALMTSLLLMAAGLTATLYSNIVVMKLARNEFAYYSTLVRHAIEQQSKALVIVDPRPIFLSEDLPEAADEQGRWLPPYELGCFSSYCLASGAIARTALRELGYPDQKLALWTPRDDDPAPGLTCEMLTGPEGGYPLRQSPLAVKQINYIREFRPLTCVNYDLVWHNLSASLVP